MSVFPTYPKTATAKRDYTIDWGDAYPGNAIASVAWSVPAGLTTVATSFTPSAASIRLAGGTLDQIYLVRCTVTLADGQIDRQSFQIAIVPRMTVLSTVKDPAALIACAINADALFGEPISSYAWSASGCAISGSTTAATVRVTAGVAGTTAYATCHLTSVGGQEDDRTIELSIQDC